MARITVEDCMKVIPNRFDMTIAASTRARQIDLGSTCLLSNLENDKPTVLALRELSENLINKEILNSVE